MAAQRGPAEETGGRISRNAAERSGARAAARHAAHRGRRAIARDKQRLVKIIRRCVRDSHKGGFRICEFNILGNHLHLITEGDKQARWRAALRASRSASRGA